MTSRQLSYNKILADVLSALDLNDFQEGLRRACTNAQIKIPEILARHPEIEALARKVKEVKNSAIRNIDELVEAAIRSLERANAKPYLAETAEEARSIVAKIVGRGKTVVMSKSMVAAELSLRQYLEELGNIVWETDLGELLIQLEGTKPMHTIAPAVHMTKERAAALLAEKLRLPLSSGETHEEIVRAVRGFLREMFIKADVGISGVNALAADTGAILTVENEGNLRLVTGLPPIHIAIAGLDKIVPTIIDAFNTVLVQAAYAGLYPPTYVNMIAGPSSTGDIEQKRVYGAHGPLQLHVIIVDNGRSRAAEHPYLWEQLRCIKCGRCQMECPVWRHTANLWGGPVYGGPMGVNWTAITMGEEAGAELAHLCLGCARCDQSCPVEIPISRIIRWLKKRYAEAHGLLRRSMR